MTLDVAKAKRHLKKNCPKMAVLIQKHEPPKFTRTRNSFETLSRAIVGQQLSGKAAQTIYGRYRELFSGSGAPKPRDVLAVPTTTLRGAGLSNAKASFLHALAEAYEEGSVRPRSFSRLSNEELRDQLTAVKGLGPWTVDMFCMFGLCRPDVLPVGDLGIRKGMQVCFRLKELPKPQKMEKLAEPWQPYRTVACHYLWRMIDTKNQGGMP
jgi:DNA-3-methyladenine glycosylase II